MLLALLAAHNFVSFGDGGHDGSSSDSSGSSAGSPNHPALVSSDHPPQGTSQASTHPHKYPPTGGTYPPPMGGSTAANAPVAPRKSSLKRQKALYADELMEGCKTEAEVQAEIAQMVSELKCKLCKRQLVRKL